MKKLMFSLLLMTPVLGFCDYRMFESKDGTFIYEDKIGFVAQYTNYNDDAGPSFEYIWFNTYTDDEGIHGQVFPTSEIKLITE